MHIEISRLLRTFIYKYMQAFLFLCFTPCWPIANQSLTIVLECLVTRKFTNAAAARETESIQAD